MASFSEKTRTPGIRKRHLSECPSRDGRKCTCGDRLKWDARVWDPRVKKHHNRTFPTEAAAKGWQRDARKEVDDGGLEAGAKKRTVREAAEAFIASLNDGTALRHDGAAYKPKVSRGYEQALRARIIPELGHLKLADVQREHVKRLIQTMQREGVAASTIRNALMPLRVIFRDAIDSKEVRSNPCERIRLPKVRRSKEIAVTPPAEARKLLAALTEDDDRAIWAGAFWSGLRCGELMALRVEDVDLDELELHVRHGWDEAEGRQAPKSETSVRDVPILAELVPYLKTLTEGRPASALVFGRDDVRPFVPSTLGRRTKQAWRNTHAEGCPAREAETARSCSCDEGIDPGVYVWIKKNGKEEEVYLGLHDARHTFISRLIAAGANPKLIQNVAGHASIEVTFDVYGHLFPDDLHSLRELADANIAEELRLAGADEQAEDLDAELSKLLAE
jgi:integrase